MRGNVMNIVHVSIPMAFILVISYSFILYTHLLNLV